jgi:hypothetical protein
VLDVVGLLSMKLLLFVAAFERNGYDAGAITT